MRVEIKTSPLGCVRRASVSQAGGEPEGGWDDAQSTPPPPTTPPSVYLITSWGVVCERLQGLLVLTACADPCFVSAPAPQPSGAQESVPGALSQLLPIFLLSSF